MILQLRSRLLGSSHVVTNLVDPNFDSPSRGSVPVGAIRKSHPPSEEAEYVHSATLTDTRHYSVRLHQQTVARSQRGVAILR